MKTNPRLRTRQTGELRTGSILIAKPFWNDDTYKRSVILLINHNEAGSTGVMINKMSNLSVHDALPELEHHAPLYYGGPVNKKTISYIHGNANIPDAYYLGNDLFWGGNYEFLQEMFESGKLSLKEFHFCAGFVQWLPGELENEINEEKWWLSELSHEELTVLSPEELWGDKLVEDEHVYGLLSPYPDPSLN
jgi:putative transcriptional regulator